MSPVRDAHEFASRHDLARSLRQEGQLKAAEALLLPSVTPPSNYHGHYRELFLIYRAWNRQDKQTSDWKPLIARTLRMITLDDELIREMELAFEQTQGGAPPVGNFDSYRKLTIGDAKGLLAAAELSDDPRAKSSALLALKRFPVTSEG